MRDKRGIWRCFTPSLLVALRAKSRTNRVERKDGRKAGVARRRRTLATPIKAETIQVQARWPTSGFETEALFAMHLRYTRARKRRGCGKGKGPKESRTNDVDNNDSRTANSGSFYGDVANTTSQRCATMEETVKQRETFHSERTPSSSRKTAPSLQRANYSRWRAGGQYLRLRWKIARRLVFHGGLVGCE